MPSAVPARSVTARRFNAALVSVKAMTRGQPMLQEQHDVHSQDVKLFNTSSRSPI